MNKYKLMLMFFALVSLTGVAAAEIVSIYWDYYQDTDAIGIGDVNDIIIPATLVGGTASDPDVILTATLPDPTFTQNETGRTIPVDAVGYM